MLCINPFITRKHQLSRIFNHGTIASQGFQIRNFFCYIFFRFQDGGKTLVDRFFLTMHKLKKIYNAIFTVLKEFILRNSNLFEFFPYLTPLKRYIKKKYSFFNSARYILYIFCTNFDCFAQLGVEWAILKIN